MSMDKRNYIKEYEKYSGLFKKHFGENADIYWKMYLNYHVDHISYDKLGILHNISKTTVRNILKRIESFLQDPWKIMREVDYSIKLLDGNIYMPNEFILGYRGLSFDADQVFHEAIYLYQHGMYQKIPRSHVLWYSTQYKNVDRRTALIEELRNCSIFLRSGESVKIFDKIEDEKGAIRFEFTKECLEYITPFYYSVKGLMEQEKKESNYKRNSVNT